MKNQKALYDYFHAALKGCGVYKDFNMLFNEALAAYGGIIELRCCDLQLYDEFVAVGYRLLRGKLSGGNYNWPK